MTEPEITSGEMQDWRTSAEIATALFVIADPVAAIPIFITMTSGETDAERSVPHPSPR